MRSRRFEKTFYHDKNADIQDYAPAQNVTDVVIFRMSKDCHLKLAIFWAQDSFNGGGAISTIDLLFCEGTLIDPPCLANLVWYRFRVILS